MEWLFAVLFAFAALSWSVVHIVGKLLRFRPVVSELVSKLGIVAKLSRQSPLITEPAGAWVEKPPVDVRQSRASVQGRQRRERSRRLSLSNF